MPATLSIAPTVCGFPDGGTIRELSGERRESSASQTGRDLETSITFGQKRIDLMLRLLDACHEASADVEAEPVLAQTYLHAEAFLGVIPPRVPMPDVLVHPDGEIAFEWHLAKDRVLTVSVGPTASVAFAALLGASTVYGRESFAGLIPDQVAHLLGRLFPSQTSGIPR